MYSRIFSIIVKVIVVMFLFIFCAMDIMASPTDTNQWIDTKGEGLSGIYTEQSEGYYYKNKSNNDDKKQQKNNYIQNIKVKEKPGMKNASSTSN